MDKHPRAYRPVLAPNVFKENDQMSKTSPQDNDKPSKNNTSI